MPQQPVGHGRQRDSQRKTARLSRDGFAGRTDPNPGRKLVEVPKMRVPILLAMLAAVGCASGNPAFPGLHQNQERQEVRAERSDWRVAPANIRIAPGNAMWFEDDGKHPFLLGVSGSESFSNFWGDPGEEWNTDGTRKAVPVTHATAVGFLWSEYLDTLASHGMTCVRELVVSPGLTAPAKYAHHYNPYPFPWVRTDAKKDYVLGYREDKSAPPGSPGRINWKYLHSEASPDFSRPQAGYFKYRVRRFCQEAKKRKIYVILTLFPIHNIRRADEQPLFPYQPNNPNVRAYVDMLLRHTQDLGNVLYEINWEGGNGDHFTWWAGYVKDKLKAAGRPTNVILVNHWGVRPRVRHSTPNSTIVGHHRDHTHGSVLSMRRFSKPVIWTEDFDEGKTNAHTPEIADVVRHRTWYSFVSGVHHIWYDWSMRVGKYKDPTLLNAAESLATFLSVAHPPFWTMSPNDALASGKSNWCLANPAAHYIVYFSGGVGKGTTLTLKGGPFKARWFNPKAKTTGAFMADEFDAPADGVFHPPAGCSPSDKLVLYVRRLHNQSVRADIELTSEVLGPGLKMGEYPNMESLWGKYDDGTHARCRRACGLNMVRQDYVACEIVPHTERDNPNRWSTADGSIIDIHCRRKRPNMRQSYYANIQGMVEEGIEPFVCLMIAWGLDKNPHFLSPPGKPGSLGNWNNIAREWKNYCKAMVHYTEKHWPGKVRYYEVQNEPKYFVKAPDYMHYLRSGYEGIKEALPTAKVAGPSWSSSQPRSEYVEYVVKHGHQYLDVVTYHSIRHTMNLYSYGAYEDIQDIRDLIESTCGNRYAKEIINSEFILGNAGGSADADDFDVALDRMAQTLFYQAIGGMTTSLYLGIFGLYIPDQPQHIWRSSAAHFHTDKDGYITTRLHHTTKSYYAYRMMARGVGGGTLYKVNYHGRWQIKADLRMVAKKDPAIGTVVTVINNGSAPAKKSVHLGASTGPMQVRRFDAQGFDRLVEARHYVGKFNYTFPRRSITQFIFPAAFTSRVLALPGRIEAEDYKTGREGVGYHDTTGGNTGGQYRYDDVDVEAAGDIEGKYNVGWISAGEWLAYDVKVKQTGKYNIRARVASAIKGTEALHIEVDAIDVTGPMRSTDSSGWQSWLNITATGVNLTAGAHELRIVMDTSGFNVNYVDVKPAR